MNELKVIISREIKIGFRNPWAYSFMALFTIFVLSLLLINNQQYVIGYTSTSATMLNLSLYLLPLMSLMLGAFSLTAEKEDRSWELLASYPLTTWSYIIGKYIGLAVVINIIIFVGFGVSSIIGIAFGIALHYTTYINLLLFCSIIAITFLAIAIMIGTLSKNRWQALTINIGIWFFLIMAWPTLLIAILGLLPYSIIKPTLSILTIINPAEFIRLFVVVKMGGGITLGPEYYKWMLWINSEWGGILFVTLIVVFISTLLSASCHIWERKRLYE